MKIKLILLFLLITFLSCNSLKSTQEAVSLEQVETNYPVTIRGNIDKDYIFSINFYFAFEYKNDSFTKRKMSRADYYYKDYGKSDMDGSGGWNDIMFYECIGDTLVKIGTHYENEPINKFKKQIFVVYTRHDVDTTKLIQSELRPYLEQMKKRGATHGKDTLSVGTFKEFKEKHPTLTKALLEGDSIRVGILAKPNKPYDEKNDIYITLPIKY